MSRPRTARALSAAIAAIGAAVALCPAAVHADAVELKWASEGYFRTRSMLLTNLAPQDRQSVSINGEEFISPDIRSTTYITSRLRLMPRLSYGDKATLTVQLDALDDVLWGDNNGLSAAPLFAVDSSNQPFLGGEPKDSVQIRRAWIDFDAKLGRMRVGRMPSHWGTGILANGGGTANLDPLSPAGRPKKALDHFFDDDFGDNHFGSTTDRILFITKPITVFRKAVQKKEGKAADSPLVVGYAFDKLSEAPFLEDDGLQRTFRPFGQQGFISRGSSDDVNEHVGLAVWNDPEWTSRAGAAGHEDDILTVGVYGVLRTATESSTNPAALDPTQFCGTFDGTPVPCVDTGALVWIADFWWRLRYGSIYTEGEIIKIGGEAFGGIPYPGANLKKRADITGGVARAGWLTPTWDAVLEVGHASGDDELEDQDFKQRALNPDYNVGLILFEETLRELTARTYGLQLIAASPPEGATGFFSNGGVINANYINPKARFRAKDGQVELVGGVLMAWVDTLARTGIAIFYDGEVESSYLGTEIDLAAKISWAGKMSLSLETGYLRYGGALRTVLPNADSSFTLQSRVAFLW